MKTTTQITWPGWSKQEIGAGPQGARRPGSALCTPQCRRWGARPGRDMTVTCSHRTNRLQRRSWECLWRLRVSLEGTQGSLAGRWEEVPLEAAMVVELLCCVRLFAAPWTVARQAPLSRGFSRQERWSGVPVPSPGHLLDPGVEPRSPALAGRFFTTTPPGERHSR